MLPTVNDPATTRAEPGAARGRAVPLAVQATERLKRMILDGDLLPGHPLIEASIAEELGMSKTPIREALRILSHSGLVTTDNFRTLRVRRLTADDVREIYEIRAALEPIAIERACRARTSETERSLAELIAQAEAEVTGRELRRLVRTNRELHRALVRDCGNREIISVLDGYEERLTLAILVGWNRIDTSEVEYQEHRAIVEVFLEGNASEAAALMRTHITEHLPRLAD